MPKLGEIREAKEIGMKGTNKLIWHACLDCRKERWVRLLKEQPRSLRCKICALRSEEHRQKISKANIGRKASKETCRRISQATKGLFSGDKNPSWKGGKIKRVCLECGEEFKVHPSTVKHGGGKFCSFSCRSIYYHKHGNFDCVFSRKPNKPEQKLMDLINKNNLPFKYTGDGSFWINHRNPDFVNCDGKKQIIELFGDYFHSIWDIADRTYHYGKYGFRTLVIWGSELKEPDKVLKKVKKFTKE